MTARIAFATWSGLPEGGPDDRLAADALTHRGHSVVPAIWDDASIEWDSFDAVVIRSTWDYYKHYREFLAWIERVASATTVWNPAPMLVWNSHKSYLLELAGHGVPIIPTERAQIGESLGGLCVRRGWEDVVVKGMVAAAAFGARYVPSDERPAFEATYALDAIAGELMVQPFVPGVLDPGEHSLVYLDGRFSHAFAKGPALPVDRRDAVGLRGVEATQPELELAERALAAVQSTPLYARVDLVQGPGGAPLLMELELLEPYLLFAGSPAAPPRFADALLARL